MPILCTISTVSLLSKIFRRHTSAGLLQAAICTRPHHSWTCAIISQHTAALKALGQTNSSNQLSHPSGCPIHVFGIEHLASEADVAEFILANRPSSVVVETALNAEHGQSTGNVVNLDSRTDDFFLGMFQQLGRQLSWEESPAPSETWQRLKLAWAGEQLAYIAAFATSAGIVFGDRPKGETFRRLMTQTTLADLDYAFGIQSWLNYQELLEGRCSRPLDLKLMGVVDRIMLAEREAYFCRCLSHAADSGQRCIVGVVGESHMPGIRRLWESMEWKAMCSDMDHPDESGAAMSEISSSASTSTAYSMELDSDQEASSESAICEAAACDLNAYEEMGVRRALLESVVRLKSVPSVVEELKRTLGPLPDEAWEPYCWTHELYAHPRMLLASLTREQLGQVCCGWNCELWDVLAPLRAVRPVNGGSALDIDLTADLRSLNYDFS